MTFRTLKNKQKKEKNKVIYILGRKYCQFQRQSQERAWTLSYILAGTIGLLRLGLRHTGKAGHVVLLTVFLLLFYVCHSKYYLSTVTQVF